jgi:hypothetical protein
VKTFINLQNGLRQFNGVSELSRGDILRLPKNRVPQTIIIRYQEIGVYGVRNSEAMVLFISKEYIDRNITFFYAFHTIYLRFLCSVILYYGLRNTTAFSGCLRISAQEQKYCTVNDNMRLRFRHWCRTRIDIKQMAI